MQGELWEPAGNAQAQVNENKLLEQPCATAGEPRVLEGVRTRLMGVSAAAESSVLLSSVSKHGLPWGWGPCRGTRWPPLLQECEMLPHMQLALILQSFFFPSVFFQLMSCCQSPY